MLACMYGWVEWHRKLLPRGTPPRPAGRSCSTLQSWADEKCGQADLKQFLSAHTAPDQAGSQASLGDTRTVPADLQLWAAPWGVRSGVSASAASLAPGVSKLKLSGAAVSLAASWWGE